MKMGDNNVIESKGKLRSEFYCQSSELLSLCVVLGNNRIQTGKVVCLEGGYSSWQTNSLPLRNLIWLCGCLVMLNTLNLKSAVYRIELNHKV